MTMREWTIYWAENRVAGDFLTHVTKVKGPLLMPKEKIVVIEKSRLDDITARAKQVLINHSSSIVATLAKLDAMFGVERKA